MIIAKNSDVAARIVTSVEGKPMDAELQVKLLMQGEEMTLLEIHFPAGATTPLHIHSHESLIYLVTGRIRTTIGQKIFELGPGDVCRHPRNVAHSVAAIEDSTMIEIKAPSPDIGKVIGTAGSSVA